MRLTKEMIEPEEEEQEQYALQQEELELRKNKPRYSPEEHGTMDDIDIIEFSEFLPNDYGYTGEEGLADYPEFFAAEEKDKKNNSDVLF